MEGTRRAASHAGSWYTGHGPTLDAELTALLAKAKETPQKGKAIIGPHAGYSYCGATAANAYKNIQTENIKRVFLLGPSHRVYLTKCALSSCDVYETPLGDIPIDKEVYAELTQKHRSKFMRMNQEVDEEEHSLEMHIPFIRKMFEGKDIKLIPVMVGSLSESAEKEYGQLFAPYLDDPETVFAISSDFCHWGRSFDYTPYDKSKGSVSEYISYLDHQGMGLIEEQDPRALNGYFSESDNTICGRHAISILLHAINFLGKERFSSKFVHYSQSSEIKSSRDSSVSYAGCVTSQNDQDCILQFKVEEYFPFGVTFYLESVLIDPF